MIRQLLKGQGQLTTVTSFPGARAPADLVWLDLLNPSRDEELTAEAAIGAALPTREEMAAIELSSRLYREGGATYMTSAVVAHSEDETPVLGQITFVLIEGRLVTVRYIEPRSVSMFEAELARDPGAYLSGPDVLLGLLDKIIDRLADVLERVGAEVEALASETFGARSGVKYRRMMAGLGRSHGITAKIRESAASLSRALIFAGAGGELVGPDIRSRLDLLKQDLASVSDYSAYVSGNITFLLDAALGMINIEQNGIIKFFSVAAVVFLPPTLVASYFGMNFEHMRIFEWRHGEAVALFAMIVSVIVPLIWFRRKGWL